ncbi:hypothetical protein MIR68_005001 [Amoeboaphelidium protococcarum]|nr:hypothetical protein MIR68_005001 [Amoeboaphelidium protococcarum]KAI3653811.1 hypothetical protein MP228_001758 [Amoeboaphelidium protococcarum]
MTFKINACVQVTPMGKEQKSLKKEIEMCRQTFETSGLKPQTNQVATTLELESPKQLTSPLNEILLNLKKDGWQSASVAILMESEFSE